MSGGNHEWQTRADDGDGQYAIACGLLAVADAIHRLGTSDAATPMGAIELLSGEVKEVATAIHGLAQAVENA